MSCAGTILNGLSHLVGADTRARFTVGLIRGFSANLPAGASRVALAQQVYSVMGESPPDANHPLDVRVDPACPARLVAYPHGVRLVPADVTPLHNADSRCAEDDVFAGLAGDAGKQQTGGAGVETLSGLRPPLVVTPHVRRAVDSFRAWLEQPEAQQSFLLVGPEGCGKR